MSLLITCEAGGERVPAWLHEPVMLGIADADAADRGSIETGQLTVESELDWRRRIGEEADRPGRYAATWMATRLGADLIINEYSSELIDVSRSLAQRDLYPKLTREWSSEDRARLVERLYWPYRRAVRAAIEEKLSADGVAIHLSVRSFELRDRGKIRRTDVGLLYDPSRGDEVDLCLDWIDAMWERVPMLRVRRNYPRRGTKNGLMQSLRDEFVGRDYVGVEVWLNRAWAEREVVVRDEAIAGISSALEAILDDEASEQTAAA